MSKFLKIYILIFFLISFFYLFLGLNLKFLFNNEVKKYKNYNFQGIECIDDEIYLISNFDHKIYKLSDDLILLEFLDTLAYYKNLPLAHFTSFYIEENSIYLVNSYDKINGFKVIANIDEVKKKKKLRDVKYSVVPLETKSNHLKYVQSSKLLFFDKSINSKNKSQIVVYQNKIEICSLYHNFIIQNFAVDLKKNKVLILDSFISHWFGLIYHFNLNDICKKKTLNFMKANKIDLILYPYYEIEAYITCSKKNIYVFNDGNDAYLYLKKL
jgi:hypothetical protein